MYEAIVRSNQLTVIYGSKNGLPVLIPPVTSSKPIADTVLIDLTEEALRKINKGSLLLIEKRMRRKSQTHIKPFTEVMQEANETESEVIEEGEVIKVEDVVEEDPFNVKEIKVQGSSSTKKTSKVESKKKSRKTKK
jgi:hypothetical protein